MPYTLKSGLLITATLIAASSAMLLANTDEWNKKKVTFSAPVAVPGKELLAGTDVLELAEGNSDRRISRS